MRRKLITVMTASVLVGSVAAFTLWSIEGQRVSYTSQGGSAIALPIDVDDLVRVSSIIFEGTVVGVSYSGNQFFPIIVPTASPGLPGSWISTPTVVTGGIAPPEGWSVDISSVRIHASNVLYTRSPISLHDGSIVEMLVNGNINTYMTPTPGNPEGWTDEAYLVRRTAVIPQIGDERLFLLRSNPDGLTYGPTYGPYCILDVTGSEVRIQSSPPLVIDITVNSATQAFLNELESVIVEQ